MGPDRGRQTSFSVSLLKLIFIFLLNLLLGSDLVAGELRAKGSPHGVIQVKSGKSVGLPPLTASAPLSLWCQAVFKDHPTPLKIQSATFYGPANTYQATIMPDGVTANFTANDVPITDAGKWKCELLTGEGVATGFIDVYLRPIVFSRHVIRVDHHETSTFHFTASGLTLMLGEDATLTCPVTGKPRPKVHWRVDGERITPNRHYSFNGTTLLIKNVTYDFERTYICVAENNYVDPSTKKDTKYELFLERRLRVKSPMGWLWPTMLIIAILVTLAVVILICEWHKKRRESKLIITDPEPDDE